MATRATDTSSSEEEIDYTMDVYVSLYVHDYTYYASTECESDFEYEGKAGNINTCEYSRF